MKKISLLPLALLASSLAACSGEEANLRAPHLVSGQLNWDANQVVPGFVSATYVFAPGGMRPHEATAISDDGFSADAVTEAVVYAPANDPLAGRRSLALKRYLRGRGIPGSRISVVTEPSLKSYRVDYSYTRVISPPCSGWDGNSIMNYDNTVQPGMGCAVIVNGAQMLADPRDLVRGSENVRPDTERDTLIIDQYRAGYDWTAATAAAGSGGSSGSGPTANSTSGGNTTGGSLAGGAVSGLSQ